MNSQSERERTTKRTRGKQYYKSQRKKKFLERELFILWIANEKSALIKVEKYS